MTKINICPFIIKKYIKSSKNFLKRVKNGKFQIAFSFFQEKIYKISILKQNLFIFEKFYMK